jgi:hypothetical protein
LSIGKYRGLNTVSHGGSWGGYRAELLRFPDQHFSVVCLCNRSDVSPERRAKQVADIYLPSVLKEKEPKKDEDDEAETKAKPEVPVAAEELKKLAGDYWSDELGVAYRLRLTNNKLVLGKILLTGGIPRSGGLAGKVFVPVGKNEFQLTGAGVEIRFQFDAAGQPLSFTLDAGRTKGMIFKRTSDLG